MMLSPRREKFSILPLARRLRRLRLLQQRTIAHLLRVACALTLLAVGCSDTSHPPKENDSSIDDRGEGSVERILQTALHALHANAAEPVVCEGCHEKLAGEYQRAKSWLCEKCHADVRPVLHAGASPESGARACWSCHDFTSATKDPTACATCHREAKGVLPAIGRHDPQKPDEDCGSCHRAHEAPSLVATKCESCHDKEQVSGHDKPGIQITGCASCHGYHEKATVASSRCTNCHRQSRAQVSVNATFNKGHVKCVTCHRQHRFFKKEVLGCTAECHDGVVAIAESKVAEHRGCLGCHDNHDVRNSPQKACETCHGNKIVPKHPKDRDSGTRCIGCHKPHKGPGAPLAVPCSSCHDNAQSDKGLHQGAKKRGPACRDCHKPHGFSLKYVGVALCVGCHGAKPFKNAKSILPHEKHRDCLGCHGETVAHKPTGERAACGSCHKDKTALVRKGHTDCLGCHDPHTKKKKPCGTCHEEKAKIARKEHKNCIGCHEPHSTQQKKPCGACHTAEAASAPKKHQDCVQCHDQHSTLVKKPCGECHTDRVTGVHAPVKGGCLMCHRPHGPKGHASPPACTSCHTQRLPGMHLSEGHKKCVSCHRSHGEQPNRKPATCLACHKDRKDHEPTATMCIGCHTFGVEK